MRRGIGRALVLDTAARLTALGFITLEVTANPHAMEFHEDLGFVAAGQVETQFSLAPRMPRRLD